MSTLSAERALTPRQLARQWGIGLTKILGFIKAGKLLAFNVAANELGRPQYKIPPESVQAFLEARAAVPVPKPSRRKRRPSVRDYYPDAEGQP